MTDLSAIETCVRQCATSKDGRGRWRQANFLRAALAERGASPAIAAATAKAAEAFGAWLHVASRPHGR